MVKSNKKSIPKKEIEKIEKPSEDLKKWIEKEIVIREWFGGGKLSVCITKPYDEENNPSKKISLFKGWINKTNQSPRANPLKGGKAYYNKQKFTIKDFDDLVGILEGIQGCAKELGWEIEERIEKINDKTKIDKSVSELIERSPEAGLKILKVFADEIKKKGKVDEKDLNLFNRLTEVMFDTKNSVELKRKEELRELIPKLSEEDPEALEVFNNLIDDWYLEDINNYTLALTNRISRIDEFGELITNEKAYETKRKDKTNSVHAFLDKNFWIIDEDYKLISSDITIKELVQKDLEKKDKSQEKKRPDFVFMSSKDNSLLVIIEIKRPSHNLKIEDGNQIMNYRTLLEKYLNKKFRTFRGFLIGNKLDNDLAS
jgi:hypothetical protein